MTYAIKTEQLTKQFGAKLAIENVDLLVPQGSIFAFLGSNGAGKTTTIKTMMNIMPATNGYAELLGVKSQKCGPKELQQIGYVSENQQLPEWMKVGAFLKFCESMYPNWNKDFCAQLIEQFELPMEQKLSSLSRGMKMKAALVSSLSYYPKLLILDEPFSGLDPLVRDEFINGILDITTEQNWTIFISSHDIDEVERLADWVGVIDKGHMKLTEETEVLQNRFRQVNITLCKEPAGEINCMEEWVLCEQEGRAVSFVDTKYREGETEATIKALLPDCVNLDIKPMSLRAIFVALAKQYKIKNLEG